MTKVSTLSVQQIAQSLSPGINFGNMLDAPAEGDWGLDATPALMDAVWQAGFRSVRLPVRWSNHAQPQPPFTLDAVFAARVEQVVDQLLSKGFTAVLDMHHYRQLDGDPPDVGDLPQDDRIVEERFLSLWYQIAMRFKGKSERLVFELYNEPHGRLTAERWNVLLARALGTVRLSNPDRVVLVGPAPWNAVSALETLRLPTDSRLIVTVHQYEPFAFTHQGASWLQDKDRPPIGVTCCDVAQTKALSEPLEMAARWSAQNDVPVYVGEFGAINNADMTSRVNFAKRVRETAERLGLPWAYWDVASDFGVYDKEAKAFHPALLKALRP